MRTYILFDGGSVKFEQDESGIICIIDSGFSFPKNTFHVFLSAEQVESYMDLCGIHCSDNVVRYIIHDAIMYFAYKAYYEETRDILHKIGQLVPN